MRRTMKAADVQVGVRYVLDPPAKFSFPDDDPVRQVWNWLRRCDRVEGREPLRLMGHDVVTVLGLGEITDDADDPEEVLVEFSGKQTHFSVGRKPRKHPVPAALVHLARRAHGPELTIELTSTQAVALRLDPLGDYFIRGPVLKRVSRPPGWEVFGDEVLAEVVEEKDLLIPLSWLKSIDALAITCSECGLPAPEEGQVTEEIRLCKDCERAVVKEGRPLADGRIWRTEGFGPRLMMGPEGLARWDQTMTELATGLDLDDDGERQEMRNRVALHTKSTDIKVLAAVMEGWGMGVSFPSKRPRPQIVEWLMGAWLNLDRQSITSAPGGPQQPPDGP